MYLQVSALVALIPTNQSASALAQAAEYNVSYSLPSFKEENPALIALSVTEEIQSRLIGFLHPDFSNIQRATNSPSLPASVAIIISFTSFR